MNKNCFTRLPFPPQGLQIVFYVCLLSRERERIEVRGVSAGESWIGGAKR